MSSARANKIRPLEPFGLSNLYGPIFRTFQFFELMVSVFCDFVFIK